MPRSPLGRLEGIEAGDQAGVTGACSRIDELNEAALSVPHLSTPVRPRRYFQPEPGPTAPTARGALVQPVSADW